MATVKNKLLGNIALPKTKSLGSVKMRPNSLGTLKKSKTSAAVNTV